MSDQFKVKDELFFKSSAEGATRGITISSAGIHGEGTGVKIDTYGDQLLLKNDGPLPLQIDTNNLRVDANVISTSARNSIDTSADNYINNRAGNGIYLQADWDPTNSSAGASLALHSGAALYANAPVSITATGPVGITAGAHLIQEATAGVTITAKGAPLNILSSAAPMNIKSVPPINIESEQAPINVSSYGSMNFTTNAGGPVITKASGPVSTSANTSAQITVVNSDVPNYIKLTGDTSSSNITASAKNISILAAPVNPATDTDSTATFGTIKANVGSIDKDLYLMAPTGTVYNNATSAQDMVLSGRSITVMNGPLKLESTSSTIDAVAGSGLNINSSAATRISSVGSTIVTGGNVIDFNSTQGAPIRLDVDVPDHSVNASSDLYTTGLEVNVHQDDVTDPDSPVVMSSSHFEVTHTNGIMGRLSGAGKAIELINYTGSTSSNYGVIGMYPNGTTKMQSAGGRVEVSCQTSGIELVDKLINSRVNISSAGISNYVAAYTHAPDQILIGEVSSAYNGANVGGVAIVGGTRVTNTLYQVVDPTFISMYKDPTSAHTSISISASELSFVASNNTSQSGSGNTRFTNINGSTIFSCGAGGFQVISPLGGISLSGKGITAISPTDPISVSGSGITFISPTSAITLSGGSINLFAPTSGIYTTGTIYTNASVTSADLSSGNYQLLVVGDSSTSGVIKKVPYKFAQENFSICLSDNKYAMTNNANRLYVSKVIANATTMKDKLGFYHCTGIQGNVMLGVYDDSGNLVGKTSRETFSDAADEQMVWLDAVEPFIMIEGEEYWYAAWFGYAEGEYNVGVTTLGREATGFDNNIIGSTNYIPDTGVTSLPDTMPSISYESLAVYMSVK